MKGIGTYMSPEVNPLFLRHSYNFRSRGMRCDVTVAVLGVGSDNNVTSSSEHVDLDLRHGIVKGYSQYVTFIVSPSPTDDDLCSARSVIRVDLSSGPFNRVRLTLDYSEPRLWTVDVSDSMHADGYGVNAAADDDDDDDDDDVGNSTRGTTAETHVRIFYFFIDLFIFIDFGETCVID